MLLLVGHKVGCLKSCLSFCLDICMSNASDDGKQTTSFARFDSNCNSLYPHKVTIEPIGQKKAWNEQFSRRRAPFWRWFSHWKLSRFSVNGFVQKHNNTTFIPLALQMLNLFLVNVATSNNAKIHNVFWNTIYQLWNLCRFFFLRLSK